MSTFKVTGRKMFLKWSCHSCVIECGLL